MTIHNVEQGTPEWHQLRAGKVTASEFGNLMTGEMEARKGEMPKTYLYKKIAEKMRGGIMQTFRGTWETEQAQILEQEARQYVCFVLDLRVKQVGFIEHKDGRCGCSPDGLIGEDGGIEIKAPQPPEHVKYLVEYKLPPAYAPQVHASLYVTGRAWWKFVSYCPKFPPLVLTIERDESIMARIAETLTAFYAQFDAALARIRALSQNDLN